MDLVTRLLLNTTQFNNNIAGSTQQVQQFQKIGQTVTSTIGKFFGVIGLGMGAMEAFKRTISSTQTTSDAFEKATVQATSSVDSFFTTIASGGDFSSFLSNLQNVIDKAGVLADTLDELGTKTLFNSSEVNDLMLQKLIQQNIAKDRSKSDKERNAALEKARKYQEDINKLQREMAATNKQAAYTTLDAAIAKQGFKGNVSRSTWDYVLKDSNREKVTAAKNEYNNKIEGYQNRMNEHISVVYGQPSYDKEYYAIKGEMEAFKRSKAGQQGLFFKVFQEMDDGEKSMLKSAIDLKNTANQQYAALSEAQLELDNTSAKINGSFNTQNKSGGSKGENAVNTGSLDQLNKELAEKWKQYNAAATDELRAEIAKVIQDLEAQKIKLNFEANYGKEGGIAELMKQPEIKLAPVEPFKLSKDIELPKSPVTKKSIKLNNEYAESLNAISNTLGAITNMTNEGTSAWFSWGATVLSATASAIPAIAALTAVKATENAVTKQQVVAEGMKSAAQTPFVGWLIALSAAASLTAAMMAIPKFATGGIVGGNSYKGDKILARLNSGEMILNQKQQGNLYGMLTSGNQNSTSGQVEFKIRGNELVGVLGNYRSKMNKLK